MVKTMQTQIIQNNKTKKNISKSNSELNISFSSFLDNVEVINYDMMNNYLENKNLNMTSKEKLNINNLTQKYLCNIDESLDSYNTELSLKNSFKSLITITYVQSKLNLNSPAFERLKTKTFEKARKLLQETSNEIYSDYFVENNYFKLKYTKLDEIIENTKYSKINLEKKIQNEINEKKRIKKEEKKEKIIQNIKYASVPVSILTIEYLFEPISKTVGYLFKLMH